MDRRPIAARSTRWASALARGVAKIGVTPNQISVLSVIFAAIGGGLMMTGNPWGFVAAAFCVQLRLICNLIDGMVAIEGGQQSPTGAVFNELPDRFSDTILIVAAGYAAGYAGDYAEGLPILGWIAALLAVLGAYIRALGASLGLPHDFSGIMDKARRMAVLTVGLVAQAIELSVNGTWYALAATLGLLAVGTAITCLGRTARLLKRLEAR